MIDTALPRSLYKYQTFGVNALKAICNAEVYYASPSRFNDPLDSRPDVSIDVENGQLEMLWRHMMSSARGAQAAENLLAGLRYAATEVGSHDDDAAGSRYYGSMLASDITRCLRDEFGSSGVLSLGSRWDCPLMWSHYSDEHRGICIEYSTDNHKCGHLGPVNYRASRLVLASDLIEWKLGNSSAAGHRIFDQCFYAKAPQWRYEKEWRAVLNLSGSFPAPFMISAVYFGMRCDSAVSNTVVKLLDGHDYSIKFYSMYVRGDGFKLGRDLLCVDEVKAMAVRSPVLFDFDDIAEQPIDA